jgi:hypothetical protein
VKSWGSSVVSAPARHVQADYRCHCGADGLFGYRNKDDGMDWYCARHRRGQWYADAYIGKAETTPMAEAEASDRPPDLQALVTAHGGYDKITPEAWAAYDAAMAEWQERRRASFRRH